MNYRRVLKFGKQQRRRRVGFVRREMSHNLFYFFYKNRTVLILCLIKNSERFSFFVSFFIFSWKIDRSFIIYSKQEYINPILDVQLGGSVNNRPEWPKSKNQTTDQIRLRIEGFGQPITKKNNNKS